MKIRAGGATLGTIEAAPNSLKNLEKLRRNQFKIAQPSHLPLVTIPPKARTKAPEGEEIEPQHQKPQRSPKAHINFVSLCLLMQVARAVYVKIGRRKRIRRRRRRGARKKPHKWKGHPGVLSAIYS